MKLHLIRRCLVLLLFLFAQPSTAGELSILTRVSTQEQLYDNIGIGFTYLNISRPGKSSTYIYAGPTYTFLGQRAQASFGASMTDKADMMLSLNIVGKVFDWKYSAEGMYIFNNSAIYVSRISHQILGNLSGGVWGFGSGEIGKPQVLRAGPFLSYLVTKENLKIEIATLLLLQNDGDIVPQLAIVTQL